MKFNAFTNTGFIWHLTLTHSAKKRINDALSLTINQLINRSIWQHRTRKNWIVWVGCEILHPEALSGKIIQELSVILL